MNLIIIGSGGREFTLAWKAGQNPDCEKIFFMPGNAGAKFLPKCEAINIAVNDFSGIADFAIENHVRLIIVGPEVPLAEGIVDYFENNENLSEIKIFGPNKKAAQLESSKDFAKSFMQRQGIPTAAYQTFESSDYDKARKYVLSHSLPVVIKADGLAAGKGVIICQKHEDALKAIDIIFKENQFGEAGSRLIIEEFLDGIELSVFVITDGRDYLLLPEAKDYKRIGEKDTGPNTGGMGSVSPVPFINNELRQKIESKIIQPTIEGLKNEDIFFRGFIFFGLINVNNEPYVIEYNVRMGDPETQVVIPRLKSDLIDHILSCFDGTLQQKRTSIDDQYALSVVMASGGYPEKYEKGHTITGLDQVQNLVIHAGTAFNNEKIVNAGGRVLAVTAKGQDLKTAIENAYIDVSKISWKDAYYRNDIGQDLLSFQ